MADPRLDRLEAVMLTLLPVDGSKVPNGQLRPKWVQAAAAAGEHVTETEFDVVRDRLLAAGLVVKGVGRGGATGRAAGAAPGPDDFTLQTAEAAAEEPAAHPVPAKKAKAAPTPRPAADEPAQVISYRHADRRKNNPEVGLVSEKNQPYEAKTAWRYDPHLDPALQFDVGRAQVELDVVRARYFAPDATIRSTASKGVISRATQRLARSLTRSVVPRSASSAIRSAAKARNI